MHMKLWKKNIQTLLGTPSFCWNCLNSSDIRRLCGMLFTTVECKMGNCCYLPLRKRRRHPLKIGERDGHTTNEVVESFISTENASVNQIQEPSPVEEEEFIGHVKLEIMEETENELGAFDFYLDLPGPVVREKILSFVSNPKDMVNLLDAIPTEQRFSKLTKSQLQFELDFPNMLLNDQLSWNMERELRRLSFESDHHRKIILQHFENFLVNDVTNERCRYSTDTSDHHVLLSDNLFRWSEQRMPFRQWLKFPMTRQVVINLPLKVKQRKALERLGGAIWDVEICAASMSESQKRNGLKCLKLMPNLRNLYIVDIRTIRRGNDWGREDVEGDAAPFELPELPFLRSLKFWINNPFTDFLSVWGKVLQKYGSQLNQLSFTTLSILPQFPVGYLPSFEALTVFTFGDTKKLNIGELFQRYEMDLGFMSNFEEAPLKNMKVVRKGSDFYHLLNYLGQTHGDTLEYLEVDIGPVEFKRDARIYPEIKFPKLAHFRTNYFFPDGYQWTFLRFFPALETLEAVMLYISVFADSQEEILKFSGWRLQRSLFLEWCNKLPNLKWVQCVETKNKFFREEVMGEVKLPCYL